MTKEELTKNWGVWRTFPEKARLVCIDMAFQMGITGFMAKADRSDSQYK